MNILFWNLNKKDLRPVIKELADENEVDLFVFCEYAIDDYDFLNAVNNNERIFKKVEDFGSEKIKMYSLIENSIFKLISFSNRYNIYKVDRLLYPTFLLVCVHIPSKVNFSEDSQLIEIINLKDNIDAAIKKTNIDKVVLLGDFNMNPFEKGMMATSGLHSTMNKRIALTGGRIVQNNFYTYFYNPMWNFLGDQKPVSGTHYYRASEHISFDWNIFDQVLLSPNLIDYISVEDIKIVFKTNSFNLVTEKDKIDKLYSDHLPLKFNIKNLML